MPLCPPPGKSSSNFFTRLRSNSLRKKAQRDSAWKRDSAAAADDEPPPARFAKLFEREEQVCAYAEAGEVTSEYVKVLMAKVLGREPAEGEVLSVPVLRAPA